MSPAVEIAFDAELDGRINLPKLALVVATQPDLRDARLVGAEGDVELDICIGDSMRTIRCRWLPDVATVEVVFA
jgi:hypothetical protein